MKTIPIHLMSWFMVGVLPLIAQSPTTSALPTDAQVRDLLFERIDKQRQSIGIVVGIIDSSGRRTVVSYGTFDAGDNRPVNGDTVFEIGSVTKVFTSLLLADMTQRGQVSLTVPVAKYLPAAVKLGNRSWRFSLRASTTTF